MSKKRYFDTKFWSDRWVVDELNPLDRYLYIYLMLNERTNVAGIYELSMRTASNETGIEKEELGRMISRLRPKVVYIDGWVVILNTIKHQNYRSPKMAQGILQELKNVPQELLRLVKLPDDFPKEQRLEVEKLVANAPKMDTVSIPYTYHTNNIDLYLNRDLYLDGDVDLNKGTIVPLGASKPAPEKVKSADIDRVFELWQQTVGYAVTSNLKSNREHVSKLIRENSLDDIEKMISGVAMSHSDQYAPRISNFIQLYKKWDDLKAWGRRSQSTRQSGGGIKI